MEVSTLVLHALNALFMHLFEATSFCKHLSPTPKHVVTLQENEFLNESFG